MKYDKWARWLIAKCAERGIAYEEFAEIAKKVVGIDVPKGTYQMQKSYLKKRTAEQMAEEPVTGLGGLAEE